MTRADAEAWAVDADVALVFYDGMDHAIVGIGQRFTTYFMVYDFQQVIDALVARDGMTPDDALEYFDFNIVGGWVGDATPCFVTRGD
jgi:ribosome biogenesis SPOUT family RNA methylase Rps3